jgi:hypothetical protein
LRVVPLKIAQALAQARGVKLVDGKWRKTALCASFAAQEPVAALLCGFSKSSIHDLYQLLVGLWQKSPHTDSIAYKK